MVTAAGSYAPARRSTWTYRSVGDVSNGDRKWLSNVAERIARSRGICDRSNCKNSLKS